MLNSLVRTRPSHTTIYVNTFYILEPFFSRVSLFQEARAPGHGPGSSHIIMYFCVYVHETYTGDTYLTEVFFYIFFCVLYY
jgi:hypothetical protein